MIFLILVICIASTYGGTDAAAVVDDGDPEVWSGLKSVLPVELTEHAEKSGLATTRIFQNTVVQKLHTQVVSDTQAIEARQKILQEYVQCSCPECREDEGDHHHHSSEHKGSHEKHDAPPAVTRQISIGLPSFTFPNPFEILAHPQETITNLFQSCETKLVLDTIKLLRVNLLQVQQRSQHITALVSCHCPHARRCRKLLDPLIFSIVTGRNDTELERAYWQGQLDGFPEVMSRGIFDSLTNAVANILTYFFQGTRPHHDQQTSPQQSPPAGIFAPGVTEDEWKRKPEGDHCPNVQVNITNSKKGTAIQVSNSTSMEEHD